MIKEYLQCIRIEAVRHANMLGNIIADLPFYKEKENESREKASFLVTGELLFFLWKIIKIYAYVVVFMYVPKLVFSKITTVGTSGFSTEDCFVFFTLVLTCVVGSIIHSGIFDDNKNIKSQTCDIFQGEIYIQTYYGTAWILERIYDSWHELC